MFVFERLIDDDIDISKCFILMKPVRNILF